MSEKRNSEQFIRVPKALITENNFKNLSSKAKLLYSLMLDRVALSRKCNWVDSYGRVYIYYKVEDICNQLNCTTPTAAKLLAELEGGSGGHLIERLTQGQGKLTKIYVKNFLKPICNATADTSQV